MNLGPLKVYYCYSDTEEDAKLQEALTKHLSPLRRARSITMWLDCKIQAGADWKKEAENQLKTADIILLLISPDFMASDYCYNTQLTSALNQFETSKFDLEEVTVLPILLRPVLWQTTPIKTFPIMLPTNKLPISAWANQDEALLNIAEAVFQICEKKLAKRRPLSADEEQILKQKGEPALAIECPQCGTQVRFGAKYCLKDGTDLNSGKVLVIPKSVSSPQTKEMWVGEGRIFYERHCYIESLTAFDQALQLDYHYAEAHAGKGYALWALKHQLEALAEFDEALQDSPDYAYVYNGKGNVFYDLGQYPEALAASEQALQLSPTYCWAYLGRGNTLVQLQRYAEALSFYEKALQFGVLDVGASAYSGKGNALFNQQEYAKAVIAYDQALELEPDHAHAHFWKGRAYELQGQQEDAKEAFEKARAFGYSF